MSESGHVIWAMLSGVLSHPLAAIMSLFASVKREEDEEDMLSSVIYVRTFGTGGKLRVPELMQILPEGAMARQDLHQVEVNFLISLIDSSEYLWNQSMRSSALRGKELFPFPFDHRGRSNGPPYASVCVLPDNDAIIPAMMQTVSCDIVRQALRTLRHIILSSLPTWLSVPSARGLHRPAVVEYPQGHIRYELEA